jgi:hypothetical protein
MFMISKSLPKMEIKIVKDSEEDGDSPFVSMH